MRGTRSLLSPLPPSWPSLIRLTPGIPTLPPNPEPQQKRYPVLFITNTFDSHVYAVPKLQPFQQDQFDVFEWHPLFLSCLRYFVDHAQYSPAVQTVSACVNILLPFQKGNSQPLTPTRNGPSSSSSSSRASGHGSLHLGGPTSPSVTLIPYIRRLIVTGFDTPAVLHGFFGDDWLQGIGRIHESERRNYLFAAKSDTWLRVKTQYDMDDGQTVPFLRPLQNVTEDEIQAAESNWSEWLAMQDWMLGPRAPSDIGDRFVNVKKERD